MPQTRQHYRSDQHVAVIERIFRLLRCHGGREDDAVSLSRRHDDLGDRLPTN